MSTFIRRLKFKYQSSLFFRSANYDFGYVHWVLTLYFPIWPEQVFHILLRHMCSGQIADKNPSLQVTGVIAVGAVRWWRTTSASSAV